MPPAPTDVQHGRSKPVASWTPECDLMPLRPPLSLHHTEITLQYLWWVTVKLFSATSLNYRDPPSSGLSNNSLHSDYSTCCLQQDKQAVVKLNYSYKKWMSRYMVNLLTLCSWFAFCFLLSTMDWVWLSQTNRRRKPNPTSVVNKWWVMNSGIKQKYSHRALGRKSWDYGYEGTHPHTNKPQTNSHESFTIDLVRVQWLLDLEEDLKESLSVFVVIIWTSSLIVAATITNDTVVKVSKDIYIKLWKCYITVTGTKMISTISMKYAQKYWFIYHIYHQYKCW